MSKKDSEATTVIEPVAEVTLGGYTARLTKEDLALLCEVREYADRSLDEIISKYDALFFRLYDESRLEAEETLGAMQQFRDFKFDYDRLKAIDVRRVS